MDSTPVKRGAGMHPLPVPEFSDGPTMTSYYKVLTSNGRSTFQDYQWPLPHDGQAGAWVDAHDPGPLELCGNGIHVTSWGGVWANWIVTNGVIYRVEIEGDTVGDIDDVEKERKIAARRARLTRVVTRAECPDWWQETQAFIDELPVLPWLRPDGNPDPTWQLFPTWSAARSAARSAAESAAWSAARSAARSAAWGAARSAARSAVLTTTALICSDLSLAPEHLDYTTARMNVWRKGYGLLYDVDGILYVYESVL